MSTPSASLSSSERFESAVAILTVSRARLVKACDYLSGIEGMEEQWGKMIDLIDEVDQVTELLCPDESLSQTNPGENSQDGENIDHLEH